MITQPADVRLREHVATATDLTKSYGHGTGAVHVLHPVVGTAVRDRVHHAAVHRVDRRDGAGRGLGAAVGTVALIHVATGSSYIRPSAPWWLYVAVSCGAAVVTLATSALPARRAAAIPVLTAAKAE